MNLALALFGVALLSTLVVTFLLARRVIKLEATSNQHENLLEFLFSGEPEAGELFMRAQYAYVVYSTMKGQVVEAAETLLRDADD